MSKKTILIYFGIVILFLVLVIGYFFYSRGLNNYSNLKITKDKHLVYTLEKRKAGNYNQFIPYVNIKGNIGEEVNNKIKEFVSNYDNNNICITYEADLNEKILSLIIKVEDYSYVESSCILTFKSFNINLDKLILMNTDELLDFYKINIDDAYNLYMTGMGNYYNSLVLKDFISEKDCDFNCFASTRNIIRNSSDLELFIKDGKLMVFKPYTFMKIDDEDSSIIYGFEIA